MGDVGRNTPPTVAEFVQRHPEARIAALARRQHGVVSLAQLRALGLGDSAVRERVRRGSLARIHRGVYAYGHPVLRKEGIFLAAVLACGPGAVLSHRAAADLLGLWAGARARVDVTVPRGGGRSRPGIEIHRSKLVPEERTEVQGIPTTTVARTLLDLAEVLTPRGLERAFDQAEILQLLDMRALEQVIERSQGRHALLPLRALLSSLDPQSKFTRSELERRFLALCADAGLPKPLVNATLELECEHLVVDFLWPRHRLVAETDGFESHRTRVAFHRDRRRDQLLLRAGFERVRFSWRDVLHDPAWVVETVQRGLASAPA